MSYTTRTTCRLCAADLLNTVLDLGEQPLANEYPAAPGPQDAFPLYIVQCVSCGHVQNPVVVDPVRLFAHDYSYTSGTSPVFRKHLHDLAEGLFATGKRSLVDIGSNDGTLIGECRRRGMRALGVDPACNLAVSASASGCLTIPAFFTVETAREIRRLMNGGPDVVTALNVFAHADDLGGIADGVAELLDPGSTFVFEVAYIVDVVAKNEIGTLYSEHLSTHSLGPLLPFFRARGLQVVDVARTPIQGGSLRVFVKQRGTYAHEGRIAEVLRAEEGLELALKQWPGRVAAEREAVAAELAPYLAQHGGPCKACGGTSGNHPPHDPKPWGPCLVCRGHGHDYRPGTLAVYGAPARLTPWAYAMGFKPDDVTCVFDDEPRKVGRYTPGLNWPVVSSSELYERNPEAILISSWNYAENIKSRFPDYRGRWLVPPREPVSAAA